VAENLDASSWARWGLSKLPIGDLHRMERYGAKARLATAVDLDGMLATREPLGDDICPFACCRDEPLLHFAIHHHRVLDRVSALTNGKPRPRQARHESCSRPCHPDGTVGTTVLAANDA